MTTTTSRDSGVPAAALVNPLPGVDRQDNFGAPRPNGRTHEGIDIFADRGTPIHAISGGTVVNDFSNPLGGIVVWIKGDDGRTYYYAHLDSLPAELEVGDRVETGEVIGTVGTTGNAATTPPHLHLQVKEDGEWINPFPFLEDLPDGTAIVEGGTVEEDPDSYQVDHGVPPQAADGDGDGLTDEFEDLLGTEKASSDTDKDGLTDLHETVISHTDPLSADTDADAQPDAVEVAAGTDAGTWAIPQAAVEAGFGGLATRDSDHDGLSDLYEIDHGTKPDAADSDEDTLPDALEIALGSSAVSNDSDRDGIADNWEYELGTLEPLPLEGDAPFEDAAGGSVPHSDAHAHGPTEAPDPDADAASDAG